MAYIDFPRTRAGDLERKAFYTGAEGVALVGQWRREGQTVEEIALRRCGVSETTFRRWYKECPELEAEVRRGQDYVNARVEESLLRRALGYVDEEETWELVEGEMRRTRVVRRPVPPDVKACLSWLYSRRSDRWRAQQEPLDARPGAIADVRAVVVSIAGAAEGASGASGTPSGALPPADRAQVPGGAPEGAGGASGGLPGVEV